MIQRPLSVLCLMALTAITACNNADVATEAKAPTMDNLIPKPVTVTKTEGVFSLNDSTVITVAPGNPDLLKVAGYMAAVLKPATGFTLKIDTVASAANSIALSLVNDTSLPPKDMK